MNRKDVDKICDDTIRYVYTKYDVVNHNEIIKNKEKLLSDIQYYPYIIRSHLGGEYTRLILQDKRIYSMVKENAEPTFQDKVMELIDWVNDNSQYKDFINTTEKQKLEKELSAVEKERKYLYSKI